MKLEISIQEQINQLDEELEAIASVKRDDMAGLLIEMKWLWGEAIVKHPLYKHYGKQMGELKEELARRRGIGVKSIEQCMDFYRSYPTIEERTKVRLSHGNWTRIKTELLTTPKEKKEKAVKCKKCEIKGHCL